MTARESAIHIVDGVVLPQMKQLSLKIQQRLFLTSSSAIIFSIKCFILKKSSNKVDNVTGNYLIMYS